MSLTSQAVWQLLETVPDPEIPVISVVELGIVQEVTVTDERVEVAITPTFSGCPALWAMRAEIEARLQAAGVEQVRVRVTLFPPWTTDRISPAGRRKLHAFGLAPPPERCSPDAAETAACPQCGSADTRLTNRFGSTLCRAIYVCNACRQPFEAMKCL